MSWGADEFDAAFRAEVGDTSDLVRPQDVLRWVNEGQARLRVYDQKTSVISWAAGAASVNLPADCHHIEDIDSGTVALPAYRVWGTVLRFLEPSCVRAVTGGTLYYWAKWPAITGGAASQLADLGDQAALSFALYRFFKRLASSRADYRMYASIAQANGVGVDELGTLAEQHLADFTDARDALAESVEQPVAFYQD